MKESLPPLTIKQKHILTFIYRYRFLNRIHIQTLLAHKSPSLINEWLADLTTKKYLNRIFSPTLKENTYPAVYSIGINGIRYLKQNETITQEQARNLYAEQKRKPSFIQHCLALANFACSLVTLMRQQQKEATFITKVDFSADTDDDKLLFLKNMKPDAYYTYNGTGIAQAAFIEVIDDYVPAQVLANKIQRYFQAANDTDWEVLDTNRFPSLILLLPSIKKLSSLQRIIKQVKNRFDTEDAEELRCNLALASDLQEKSIADDIWLPA